MQPNLNRAQPAIMPRNSVCVCVRESCIYALVVYSCFNMFVYSDDMHNVNI